MNNKPVAYGKYLEEQDYWVTVCGIIPNPKEGYVPLYTHPAKTLTDEEIEKEFYKMTTTESGLKFESMHKTEFISVVKAILIKVNAK